MKKILILSIVTFVSNCYSQFTGHSGVYYLGTASVPISTVSYASPMISGAVIRFKWEDLEASPGNFNWSYLDGEIVKATSANKKVCIQPIAMPSWMSTLGVQTYSYVDKNINHSTYGQVLSDVIPWDTIYVKRYKLLLQQLASKYASNPVVTYVNTVGGAFSRGLPDTVVTNINPVTKQPFWIAHNYNADTLAALINKMTDFYMNLFPNTHLWCSIDYVTFETNASGKPKNYLASQYTNYGVTNYSSRFGLWREDLSGCNPNIQNVNSGSHWNILKSNPCRTGAQMLWNVQDGPTRMNQCGINPNMKNAVLDSAVSNGLALGMRYMEIYGADINDVSLSSTIQQANTDLNSKGIQCYSIAGIIKLAEANKFRVYPNPATEYFTISSLENIESTVIITDATGRLILEQKMTSIQEKINISSLAKGIYFVQLAGKANNSYHAKIVKE